MYCRFCGKEIEEDSRFCKFCGKKLADHVSDETHETANEFKRDGTYKAPDGKEYKVIDGVMYDENGYSVGRAPRWWSSGW